MKKDMTRQAQQPSQQTEQRANKPEKKAASTSRRIRRGIATQLFLLSLLLDALFVCLAVGGKLYTVESRYLSERDPRVLSREITARRFDRDTVKNEERIIYEIVAEGKQPLRTDVTEHIELTLHLLPAAVAVELVLLLLFELINRLWVYWQLRPLNALADAAQRITRANFETAAAPKKAQSGMPDASRIHTLETEIERLEPMAPQVRLHTGDDSLMGLETAINDLLARMQAAYAQQTRFVSDASHELRTPIAVVKGYADLLNRWGRTDPEILDEGIRAIQTETAHMSHLVEQLLFLARGDSGRTQMRFETLSLAALCEEVYAESEMIHPTHRWQFQTLADPLVTADAAMLKQAVRILIDNAVKYTKEGESIRLRVLIDGNGQPCIEVQDSGIGIDREDLKHVFERFFRADPARTGSTGGTGLGLSIAKWIVDRHGGSFTLTSEREAGTRIRICLPKAK